MKIIKKIFSFSHEKKTAHKLYKIIVKQARHPVFYKSLGVADTFDGRFDMISLHMIIVIRRMKRDVDQTRELSQALFDFMFEDFDLNLRELGIGDMGVLHRVKKMTKAFYGRLEAYDRGLEDKNNDLLIAALERNLFRENEVTYANLRKLTEYVRRQVDYLDKSDINTFLDGDIEFNTELVKNMNTGK